jgi:tetratricopeptide (TPR) repeat protein
MQRVRDDPAAEDRSVTELLGQADEYFQRKQYLTPSGANAYAIYRTVLSLDPANPVALSRIAEMLDFYRSRGEGFCRAGDATKAGIYFQRYLLIEPGDDAVRERAATCAAASGEVAKQSEDRTGRETGEQAMARRDRVRQLLDESGVESSWIMDYLFDDKENDEAEESETPWR